MSVNSEKQLTTFCVAGWCVCVCVVEQYSSLSGHKIRKAHPCSADWWHSWGYYRVRFRYFGFCWWLHNFVAKFGNLLNFYTCLGLPGLATCSTISQIFHCVQKDRRPQFCHTLVLFWLAIVLWTGLEIRRSWVWISPTALLNMPLVKLLTHMLLCHREVCISWCHHKLGGIQAHHSTTHLWFCIFGLCLVDGWGIGDQHCPMSPPKSGIFGSVILKTKAWTFLST